MENELVANERTRWVRRYARVIQIVGILVILSTVGYGVWVTLNGSYPTHKLTFIYEKLQFVNAMMCGVAALTLAQLLRYVFGETRKSGILVRFADKGLFIWAGLILLTHFVTIMAISSSIQLPLEWWTWRLLASALVPIANALVLIALALVLRRALPIVEESRSLV